MAGCRTAISNVVMAIVVMLTLLLITPLFKYTPNAILASIIINAVLGLIDFEAAYLLWKVDKMDFVACLGAFFGVIFASVEYGLLIAVRVITTSFLFVLVEYPPLSLADDC
jgi:high affinity sulfate transporter 1